MGCYYCNDCGNYYCHHEIVCHEDKENPGHLICDGCFEGGNDMTKEFWAVQAIETKYLGPTDKLNARVKAKAQAGSITLIWDDDLNTEQNHAAAAIALANKWGWLNDEYGKRELHVGATMDGYCFVFTSNNSKIAENNGRETCIRHS